jgi:uncharacterized membrane protein
LLDVDSVVNCATGFPAFAAVVRIFWLMLNKPDVTLFMN